MNRTLSRCPKCGDPPDDVMGRVCGHEIHTPHVEAEDRRLDAIINGGRDGAA